MFFGFNLVDLLVIIFLVVYAVLIFRRGFLAEFFELVGFALSLLVGLLLFPFFSRFLQLLAISPNFANTISFLVLWVATEIIFVMILRDLFKKIPMFIILSRFNRYFGLIPNLISSLLIVTFLGLLLIVLPTSSSIKDQVTQSRILRKILPVFSSINPSIEAAFSASVRDGIVHLLAEKNIDETKSISLNFPSLTLKTDLAAEDQLLSLLNGERKKQNLKTLALDVTMAEVARDHSDDMFRRSYFGHLDPEGKNPLDRAKAANLVFSSLGENISYAPDALTAHTSFMNSKGHRDNILLPRYSRVGIGAVDSGSYGEMFTELFAD